MLCLLAVALPLASAEEPQKLTGLYRWDDQDLSGNLEAVFTPSGESTWDVSFHFTFQGPHTFVGTATGSLRSGKLEGKVVNENETRTFEFQGTVKKGKFRGTHFEATGGLRRKTGTLTMKPAR